MYGTVSSAWTIEKGTFALAVELPANTTATVRIPNTTVAKVTEGGQPVAVGNGITAVRQDGKTAFRRDVISPSGVRSSRRREVPPYPYLHICFTFNTLKPACG
jgi:hypothetical protein